MHKRILSASVSVRKETSFTEFQFLPGINILCGADAEDIVFTLAGIFGGMPPKNGKAEIQWCADTSLFVDIIDGACGIEDAITHCKNTAQLVKDFHKQRYLYFGNAKHIFRWQPLTPRDFQRKRAVAGKTERCSCSRR